MCRQSENNLLNSNNSSTCPDNMVNFGLITAENCWWVWGTPSNFNGFRGLAALLHGILQQWASAKLCGVEQRAPPIFGRAAITLGIGPHSSLYLFYQCLSLMSSMTSCTEYLTSRIFNTRMWTNAQRDGRPAEHRWRPLFNAAKFG